MKQVLLRIHYPVSTGRIVLRTEDDWDTDVEPTFSSPDGTRFDFAIATERPYFYFKPVLLDCAKWYWARGFNYLALASSGEPKDVYPHFFEEHGGLITDDLGFGLLAAKLPAELPAHHLKIYHPPGYFENRLKRYPVLYMHDGNNLFFPREAFMGTPWKVDRTMQLLDAMNVIQPAIVVGIYPEDRMHEYTQPGYEIYGKYMVELKQCIDRSLRTRADARSTAVMGSSLGGVVSLYLAWQWPQVFGMAACMSSTFTWRDDLMQRIESEPARPIKIYIDSGWPGDNFEVTRSMRDLLLSRGWKLGQDLLYFAFPEHEHNETAWATRSHVPFQFFFADDPYPSVKMSLPL
ncbi:MAG: alpha/beta hydrolase [Candidatus Xenobia bacterium]